MPLISLENISVDLIGRRVLNDVTLSVDPSEIITIVGPNGSGKTSLLKLIAGSLKAAEGTLHKNKELKLGYVPQKLTLDRTLPMTVARFLSLPRRWPKADRLAALERVGATATWKRQITELSGGQLQRVLLARAILGSPDLLLLDEPTTGLDQAGSASFYKLLAALRDELKCAILQASHELHVVMSASDRVVCLNGHVCCQGAPDVVVQAPEYRALFGSQTGGALALYRHEHDHAHDHHTGRTGPQNSSLPSHEETPA